MKQRDTIRAALYLRVSTDEQHAENQLPELERYAEAQHEAQHGPRVGGHVLHASAQETSSRVQRAPGRTLPVSSYETRAKYMVDTDQGLTQTYNHLKDPDCTEPRIVELRELHLEMDRTVLAAYGWSDLPVPRYPTPRTPAEEKALETFQDEVIDRLFVLNAERAEEERLAGASTTKGKGKGKGKGKPRAAAKGKKPAAKEQLALVDEEDTEP
jgi:hypothetical protein